MCKIGHVTHVVKGYLSPDPEMILVLNPMSGLSTSIFLPHTLCLQKRQGLESHIISQMVDPGLNSNLPLPSTS